MISTTSVKDRLEFITVTAEFTLFLENASQNEKKLFIEQAIKYLTAIYLKTVIMQPPIESFEIEAERVVSEADYEWVRSEIALLLGVDDDYLTAFHPDMAYSDTPIAASVSEDLADIYQEIKDFLYNCQLGNDELMLAALETCLNAFREHWGRKLLNSLSALHQIICSQALQDEENEPVEEDNSRERAASFLRHQSKEDNGF
jgi:hypothetical protein